nr:MAG TPA: DVL family [Caudoviricetes sp.]
MLTRYFFIWRCVIVLIQSHTLRTSATQKTALALATRRTHKRKNADTRFCKTKPKI